MRKHFIKIYVLLVTGIAFSCNSQKEHISKQPNIIFIMADDLGYGELGCYGSELINTPNIDRLAQEGVKFTNFYANAPVCSPTRIAFLTGYYQQRIGIDDALYYQEMGRGIPISARSFIDELKTAGYATGLFGKWHAGYDFERRPLQQGFDYFFGILGGNHHYFNHIDRIGAYDLWIGNDKIMRPGYTTDLITDEAVNFIKRNNNQPFFLYFSHLAPHFPYIGPGEMEKDIRPNHKSWNDEDDPLVYKSMVESMDSAIGRVLKQIEESGLSNNTIVVFTSDNGGAEYAPYVRNYPFNGYKSSIWEGGIRVPCIAKWPGVLPTGKIVDQVGITFDWTHTFSKIAGIKYSHNKFDGIDLLSILKDEKQPQQRDLFWRVKSGPIRKKDKEYRAVRSGEWKFVVESVGNREIKYLFNIEEDPGEQKNLVGNNTELEVLLNNKIKQWEGSVDSGEHYFNNN